MEHIAIPVGSYETNCYLVWDALSREGIIIDPGFEPEKILARVRQLNLSIKALVNTHGHLDHIGGNAAIVSQFNCPLCIGAADATLLEDPKLNHSARMRRPVVSPAADRLLRQGDVVEFGHCQLKVAETPGHTPGGISLLGDGRLFCGDTLFAGAVGRTDLPGGSHQQLLQSICSQLLTLPDETVVLPGHGPATTIGEERKNNPWLQG